MNLDEIRSEMEAIEAAVQAETDGGAAVTDEQLNRYDELAGMEARAVKLGSVIDLAATRSKPVLPRGVGYVTGAKAEDDTLDRAFDHYLRTGVENGDLQELRAQSEGVGGAGGFTVPQGFLRRIVDRMVAFGGIAGQVEVMNTTEGNPIEWPELDDTGNTGDITAEGTAPTAGADMVFTKNTLGAYKYTSTGASGSPIRVSFELAQDSAFDLAGLIANKLGERIARKQAAHWATGTGVEQPLGLVAASLTSDRDLDTADTPDYEDLVEFQDLLDEAYEPNAKWLMRKNTWSQLRLLVDGNLRPLIQSSLDGISGKPVRMLLGSEVVIAEEMPLLSSAGDTYPIAYGDFREAYVIRRVQTPTVLVNPYTRQSQGEIEYSAWARADGTVKNRNAYKILQNNT
jgi:HK97 family phage major capsid protein